ncbi:MAG: excinuclease ABC subunit UvrC [Alphaproteobacteria bacterium]|jgi:excinuclease ABC subunit C|nr:excinuclease ABC subunit UvrC [Alphaproteobacteria bacterium]MBT4083193.1 excinuclease ABC subunit UvrC [Alphaproteobacteria bacterium]MBT4546259.1 excinuclease ABC subunit UvrC [Alphaproteobacteria bacterium]MBT6385263.1 excinuclease ABC subunit UvrC [Alphaproteobacteria bacterium]MBT7747776.1 excinuclease ABC subunit UvrC [Alphaproteobacteria bacterium]
MTNEGSNKSPDSSALAPENSADGQNPEPEGEAESGFRVVARYLKTLPGSPGVYRMMDAKGQVLYVGKAKNLKKRVVAYTKPWTIGARISRMVAATTTMEFITTHTEAEALLLESNLIKKLKPRYNILLKDDKSFPYILIRGDHEWAQITKHRGARNKPGEYFGPFASASSVNSTINALARVFPLRSCSDSIFDARTRPCLQFQIKRCTAPCVDRISPEDYSLLLDDARAFLKGKTHDIQGRLSKRMQRAAETQDYETAAVFRDRIKALTAIQARQGINVSNIDEADVISAWQEGGSTCIQVFFFRSGQNYGNRAYFPIQARDAEAKEVMGAFIGQFYADRPPPKTVLLSHAVERADLIEEALGVRAGHRVRLAVPKRGDKLKLIEHARINARDALARRTAESASQRKLLDGVARLFDLEQPPNRIEVYDNSHIQGSQAVGGMIVAGPDGLMKNQYRKFNFKDEKLVPGDDFGMMREVLTRRFARLMKEDEDRSGGMWPDLILIDGGAGQLSTIEQVFADLGVSGVCLVAIAKGPDRNAGREVFHVPGKAPFSLPERDAVLFFLQRLRDEAHRFAIGTHRAKRSRAIHKSPLDGVPGVGAARKKALLHRFGSGRAVEQAGIEDLATVEGVSQGLAQKIYDHFHSNS